MEEHPLRGLILIAVFIGFSSLISAAETALKNTNEGSLKRRVEEGDKLAVRILKLAEGKASYTNVVELLLITVNLLIGIIFSFSHYHLAKEFIQISILKNENTFLTSILMVIFVGALIYFIVLFGVLLPSKLALLLSEKNAYQFSSMIYGVAVLLYPLLWLLDKNTLLLLKILRIKPEDLEDNVTEEEIISIVQEGHEQGLFEAEEAEMISNIIEFDEKEAKDIMTHRKKIVAINADLSIEDALRFMIEENYSRFPIYQNDIDDIIGVLHLKDVVTFFMNPIKRNEPLITAASEPYFVPDTQSISLLLHDMQSKKVHMAIVIDEYGQTAGLVAMEDILEEIVGDIQDEYDEEDELIFKQEDGSYLVTGDAPLEDITEKIEIQMLEDDMEDYDTLNGLLISKLDRIPTDGETAILQYVGYQFEILDTKNKMIKLVKMSKINEQETVVNTDTLDNNDKSEKTDKAEKTDNTDPSEKEGN